MRVRIETRKVGEPFKQALRVAERLFLIGGGLMLAYCAFVCFEASLYQASQARRFEEAPRPSEPGATKVGSAAAHKLDAAVRRTIEKAVGAGSRPAAVSRIEIPRLGISSVVVEGVDSSDLTLAVGHVPGTALPGQVSNVAIAGHRDTFFRKLGGIRQGDRIILATPGASYPPWTRSKWWILATFRLCEAPANRRSRS
jgi:sortase A